jgi:RHS repeat-associated protein
MNRDYRKNLDFTYNLLNLPYQVKQQDTVRATYTYLADGTKLATTADTLVAGMASIKYGGPVYVTQRNGFDYFGSLVYTNNNGTRTLESTNFGGGRINRTGTNAYDINYFITDHLGSTRVIVDNNGIIKEQKDYYPFGKEHENSSLMSSTNRWNFNGKEKQTIKDLGWLDFSARMYANCEVPLFTTPDPLMEKYYSISQYAFCGNNPINRIDPNGMDWYSYERKYMDDDGEEQTRIEYKYVRGTMSDDDMKAGGYTHLGKTYLSDGTYYSLGGAILNYDKSDMQNFGMVANVMAADFFTITAVNAFKEGSDFWNKYSEYISTGSNAANAVANFMDASSKIAKNIKGIGYVIGGIQILQDGISFVNGEMTTEKYIDAAVNVISTFGGGYGAGFGFMYNQYKNAGKFIIKMKNEGERYLEQKLKNPATYIWGW